MMNYTVSPNGKSCMIIPYDETLKSHLRIVDDSDEALIKLYIKAAGNYIEKYIGKPLLSYDVIVMIQANQMRVNLPSTVSKITKIEEFNGTEWVEIQPESLELEDYGVYKAHFYKNYKSFYQYRVTCDNEPCITPIMKQAAFLLVAEYYENRENKQQNFTVFRPHVNNLLDLEISLI
jgi:hypothetical protein